MPRRLLELLSLMSAKAKNWALRAEVRLLKRENVKLRKMLLDNNLFAANYFELEDLVRRVSLTGDTDEAWEMSERCYDYMKSLEEDKKDEAKRT